MKSKLVRFFFKSLEHEFSLLNDLRIDLYWLVHVVSKHYIIKWFQKFHATSHNDIFIHL